MKNVLILEDNRKTLKALEDAVGKISGEICIFPVATYEDACRVAFSRRIDVFLIDIILTTQYPGDVSGMKFAQQLRKYENYLFTPIIFITALEDPELYAYKEIHSFGYLEKPFSLDRVIDLVKKALRYHDTEEKEKVVWLRKNGILFAVQLRKVMYVEVRKRVLYIHMEDDLLELPNKTIRQFLDEAQGYGFCQCSRNTIVNRQYIKNIDTVNRYISLSASNELIEIGPTFRRKFAEEIVNG